MGREGKGKARQHGILLQKGDAQACEKHNKEKEPQLPVCKVPAGNGKVKRQSSTR